MIEDDWGYQACSLEDLPNATDIATLSEEAEILVNTVLTYGVGSVHYWLHRLAALAYLRAIGASERLVV